MKFFYCQNFCFFCSAVVVFTTNPTTAQELKQEQTKPKIAVIVTKNKMQDLKITSTLSTIQLIDCLKLDNEKKRNLAELYLIERLKNEDDPDFCTVITDWYKYIKNAVKSTAKPEVKLHALNIYAALGNIPNMFLKDCLASGHSEVVQRALHLAHLADNSFKDDILAYSPKPEEKEAYLEAIKKFNN